jgi:hypothetical protein
MRAEKARHPIGHLGWVIPRLLIVVGLVDVALRFMPVDPLTFRAWEALTRYRPPGAAFEPNRQYHSEKTYGDSAAMGNMRELRQYRRERFTTDGLGFRNIGDMRNGGVAAIMIGDSNVAGSGVSDDQTLPSRLSKLSGCGVYNAGSEDANPGPDQVLALAHKLNVHRGLVIHVYSEDRELPTVPPMWKRKVNQALAWTPRWVGRIVGRIRGVITVSPLQILSERAMKAVENDRILPNRYATNVVKETVHNGDPMLFAASRVENFSRKRDVGAEYWSWLRAGLQKERLDLLVLLLPSKYRVYRPFFLGQAPGVGGVGDYLDRLARELRAAGVPVLNLAPRFAARAAEELARHEYLYWLDDIHWNARGIDLGAVAIREVWPLAGSACTPGHPVMAQQSAVERNSIGK